MDRGAIFKAEERSSRDKGVSRRFVESQLKRLGNGVDVITQYRGSSCLGREFPADKSSKDQRTSLPASSRVMEEAVDRVKVSRAAPPRGERRIKRDEDAV